MPVAGPDVHVAYVFAFREVAQADEWIRRMADLAPEVVVRERAVTVVVVHSPVHHPLSDLSGRHALIDRDLDDLRVAHPEVGAFYPQLDGTDVGTRWPIVLASDPSLPAGPAAVRIDAGWDNVVIEQADADLRDRLVRLVATTLARYRILEWCIASCRSVLMDLRTDGVGVDDVDSGSRSLASAHDNARIARVITDPRVHVYWGCEQRLVADLYGAWSMETLERSAAEALDTTAAVIADRRAALAMASSRQAGVAIVVLTVISGISGIASLIEFAAAGSGLQWTWLPRGLLAVCMVAVSALLLVLLRARLSAASDRA